MATEMLWEVQAFWMSKSRNQDGTGSAKHMKIIDCEDAPTAHRVAKELVEMHGAFTAAPQRKGR